ncbi:2-dehydro-3-deoxyphosphooctonate aldolase [Oceaniferula spumae]|uniref:3-deoxy-8-phosphooctulonate synthase n=1 Tax=Oceaniferula spumae TaxID=2979115 RepID=A0AAT9FNN4_9BACT
MKTKTITVGDSNVQAVKIGGDNPLAFIGGPCAIESRDHCLKMAVATKKICDELDVPLIFKACYDKDCRSSPTSFHGVGIDEGLAILDEIRSECGVPVTSDFSVPEWAVPTAEVVDFLQVPAYLCRQTSILRAAAAGGKPVHLKKGQFMSPWNMKNSVRKLASFGCDDVLLTDRGTFLGYNMLINDYRCFPIMRGTGVPVCYDGTHSIQMPTSMGDVSGGQREFIPFLVRAAAACGIDALFLEVHDDPPNALSDANTVLDIKHLKRVLIEAKLMHETRLGLVEKYGEEEKIS